MSLIESVRPTATLSAGGWTPSAGTLHGATSDNSDATYATWASGAEEAIFGCTPHAPATGYQRHRARVRLRAQDGGLYWAVGLPAGTFTAYGSAGGLAPAFAEISGSYGAGIPHDGTATFRILLGAQESGIDVSELWIDIDSREAPAFTLQTLDATGTPETAITDTNSPSISFDSLLYDGLTARQWRAWVQDGSTIVWDTGIVTGIPLTPTVAALPNGSYTAHGQIWSTLGSDTAYPSDVEVEAFTINVVAVEPPALVEVTWTDTSPLFTVNVTMPTDMGDYDGEVAYVEIQRIDCNGTFTVDISGPHGANDVVSYVDWSIPRSMPVDCDEPAELCEFTWRARLVGLVDGVRVSSTWVDV